jgi:hypothetical protein
MRKISGRRVGHFSCQVGPTIKGQISLHCTKAFIFFYLRQLGAVKWEWKTLHNDIRVLFTLWHVHQFRRSKVCYLLWKNVQYKNRQVDIKTDYGENMLWGINRTQRTQNFELEILTAELRKIQLFWIVYLLLEIDELSSFTAWFTCEVSVLVFGLFICFKLLQRTCKNVNILGTVGILRL